METSYKALLLRIRNAKTKAEIDALYDHLARVYKARDLTSDQYKKLNVELLNVTHKVFYSMVEDRKFNELATLIHEADNEDRLSEIESLVDGVYKGGEISTFRFTRLIEFVDERSFQLQWSGFALTPQDLEAQLKTVKTLELLKRIARRVDRCQKDGVIHLEEYNQMKLIIIERLLELRVGEKG